MTTAHDAGNAAYASLYATIPIMLFVPPHEELSDNEIAEVLRQSIATAGRLPRHSDLLLAGICAEHLVDGFRAARLLLVYDLSSGDCIDDGGEDRGSRCRR